MRRAPGWIVLAGIGLELGVLAFLSRVVYTESGRVAPGPRRRSAVLRQAQDDSGVAANDDSGVAAHDDSGVAAQDEMFTGHGEHSEAASNHGPSVAEANRTSPIDFIKESAGEDTRYYRASDDRGTLLYAGFYADGRVRLADENHRFAGMVQNGRAELLDIENNAWSELFLSVTPSGQMQLELRGGPYDARVLTCDKVATI